MCLTNLQAIQKGAMRSNQFVDLEATNYDGKLCRIKDHMGNGHRDAENIQYHTKKGGGK